MQTRVDRYAEAAGERAHDANLRPPATRVVGVGSALPERVVTNADLATMVDTSDEWIVSRTGIEQRCIAAEGEYTSDLAERAARAALASAGWGAEAGCEGPGAWAAGLDLGDDEV